MHKLPRLTNQNRKPVTHKVHFRSFDVELEVADGQTILDAALAAKIDYPCGCQSGNCGACKSRLFAGKVDLAPYSEFALEASERGEGLVLACRSIPLSDCEISPLDQDEVVAHPHRIMNCGIAHITEATHDIRIIGIDVTQGGPFSFSPGQYASLTFAGLPPRDFSMANSPSEDRLEFHIRHVKDGKVSDHILNGLKVGDTVNVEGPHGVSYLRELHRGPILAVAGSTGLAPIKSIVLTALQNGMKQSIYLYFGVRDEHDLYMTDDLEQLATDYPSFTFTPVLSEPSADIKYRTGLVTDAVLSDFDDLDGCKAYIAGPPAMVEDAVEKFRLLGVRSEDCHADAFYTEAEKAVLDQEE